MPNITFRKAVPGGAIVETAVYVARTTVVHVTVDIPGRGLTQLNFDAPEAHKIGLAMQGAAKVAEER